MNRIVLFGLSTFFSLVGIGLIGSPKPARAGYGIFFQGCHHAWNPCWGCHGCSGSCSCYGAKNCSHSCYGCYSSGGCYGCHGCYGCSGCYSSCYGYRYAIPVEVPIDPVPIQPPMPTETTRANLRQQDASADLIVRLPADARLSVDDHVMHTLGTARHLRSPQLAAGKTYQYELRAEITRDGQTTTETKLVKVIAGKLQEVTFDLESPPLVLVSQR